MFSDPEHNIEQFGINERAHVVDLGAGSGLYTIAAARAVRNFGKVYAVEVQKDLALRIKTLAKTEGLTNVETLWGDIERRGGTKLGDESMDAAIVSNVLFQLEDKQGFVDEVKRILKPGGKIMVIDWSESFGGMGPEPDAVIALSSGEDLFAQNGFDIDREIDAGAHHWGFVGHKKGSAAASVAFENKFA